MLPAPPLLGTFDRCPRCHQLCEGDAPCPNCHEGVIVPPIPPPRESLRELDGQEFNGHWFEFDAAEDTCVFCGCELEDAGRRGCGVV